MKSNTINIDSSKPIVLISLDEYEYLKSLETAVKHPERYENTNDPDYLSPAEIVFIYETNKKISDGDMSDFVGLEEYIKTRNVKKERNLKSKELLLRDKKNVYSKIRKKGSKVS